jgi:hypothetical protein
MKTDIGDKYYYCNLFAAGGWEKQVSLSQHMRHMYKSEYNASIEILMKKRRWTRNETLILAELETNLPSSESANINLALANRDHTKPLNHVEKHQSIEICCNK